MTIYISGPMTGMPDLNRPAFNAAAAALRDLDFARVRHFDRKQCLTALAMPDLQKTVTRAVERRLRQLERSQR